MSKTGEARWVLDIQYLLDRPRRKSRKGRSVSPKTSCKNLSSLFPLVYSVDVNKLYLCLLPQEFSVDPVDRLVPSSFVTPQGYFLSNPVKHSLDGAFAARLVRAL
ncbi:hypothetical protein F2Q68_00032819 [Brassica cretica]|uniref:Uncharacterized protein n=1 Tax=Brassica cretica TaxID=69181 RepID=A0A8S9G8K7_BRACR|nr:hypothetical protein F2Q68_00032819 [Brassica cretica]